jgi:hypothetical protein
MTYSLTAFSSIFDNKTHRQIHHDKWEDFEAMLYKMAETPGYKLKRGERKAPSGLKASPLISPAVFPEGKTRANDNVIEWAGWAALDIDDHKFEGNLQNELHSRFGNYYYVCYSTSSSTTEHPKFRLVFPLNSSVRKEQIKHFWYALNKEFGDIGDGQTKDLSRMYYVPAIYPSAHNFIFTNSTGSFINPIALMDKHPFAVAQSGVATFMDRLPPEVQKKVVNHREELLKQQANYNFEWTSYRDCPFVNKKMVNEYSAISGQDGSGRYAMIYKLMTSIACNAIKRRYPITSNQIAELIRQLDRDTSRRYQKRPLQTEAERALEYAYRTADI